MKRRNFSKILPIGFADQLLDLQMRLQDQQSIELIQTLLQFYKIGVQYYLENDLKRAEYMQRKQNALTVRAINIKAENRPVSKVVFERKMREEVQRLNQYQSTYISSLVNQTQKSQKRIQECVLADLTRQQQQFQDRMLKRIKSAGKL